MAYSSHRNAEYKVSGRDMLSYGFKYGQPWAEDRHALERAFREMDVDTRTSGSQWATPTSTYERRTRDSGESVDNNNNQVVRFGGNRTSSSRRSGPSPSGSARPLDIRDNHIRNYSRAHTGAAVAGMHASSTTSDNGWDLESSYDYHDWDAPSEYSSQGTFYSASAPYEYRTQIERYDDHEVHESYGQYPTSMDIQGSYYSGSTVLSDSDEEYNSDTGSRYSEYTDASEYVGSPYLAGSDYREDAETYISDDYYSNSSGEETYDSDGVFSGSIGDDESDEYYFEDDGDDGDDGDSD